MTVRILNCDVMAGLGCLPDESVHCVVTSPPYWGLRDYDAEGQIGLEPTLDEHIERLVAVFREVRRVLRKDGTVWLNYGDCYAASVNGRSAHDTKLKGNDDRAFRDKPFSTIGGPLKPKDLCMAPHRLAIALQEDGWWVRADIVWAKPNPMPESIKDRPTKAHEYVFLLTKSARYFYDAEAIKERAEYIGPNSPESQASPYGQGYTRRDDEVRQRKNDASPDRRKIGFQDRWDTKIGKKGNANGFRGGSYVGGEPGKRTSTGNVANETLSRNKRSVWTIATAPFPEAHFATFPPALPEICIKAGCPIDGTVLDPFGGAGTVAVVAEYLQRDSILIEINPEYVRIAGERLAKSRGPIPSYVDPVQTIAPADAEPETPMGSIFDHPIDGDAA